MSLEERLQTEKKQLKVICDYLVKQCETDETLKNRIIEKENNSVKGMFAYIRDKAKEQADDGVAMIEDTQVFKWACDYWLDYEEQIKETYSKNKTFNSEDDEEEEQEIIKIEKTKKPTKEEAINKLYDGLDLFGIE